MLQYEGASSKREEEYEGCYKMSQKIEQWSNTNSRF